MVRARARARVCVCTRACRAEGRHKGWDWDQGPLGWGSRLSHRKCPRTSGRILSPGSLPAPRPLLLSDFLSVSVGGSLRACPASCPAASFPDRPSPTLPLPTPALPSLSTAPLNRTNKDDRGRETPPLRARSWLRVGWPLALDSHHLPAGSWPCKSLGGRLEAAGTSEGRGPRAGAPRDLCPQNLGSPPHIP